MKLKRHTDALLRAYPIDPVLWAVNARCSRLLGLEADYEHAMNYYRKALADSTFWSAFFQVYGLEDELGLEA